MFSKNLSSETYLYAKNIIIAGVNAITENPYRITWTYSCFKWTSVWPQVVKFVHSEWSEFKYQVPFSVHLFSAKPIIRKKFHCITFFLVKIHKIKKPKKDGNSQISSSMFEFGSTCSTLHCILFFHISVRAKSSW